jgi:hypothetical protein
VAAHRLAWVFDNPAGNFALLSDDRVEASHLCFHSRCVNGLHIAMEPRAYNQSRSYCLFQWVDSSVNPPRIIDVCPHLPKCMRRGEVLGSVIDPWNEQLFNERLWNEQRGTEVESTLPPPGHPTPAGRLTSRMDELLSSFARASEVVPESAVLSEGSGEVDDEVMTEELD